MGFERQYPEGRLNGDDEGAVEMAIVVDEGVVKIVFKKPVSWIGLPKDLALKMANLLFLKAAELPD